MLLPWGAGAAGGTAETPVAPDGPPTFVILSYHSGTLIRVEWQTGDEDATSEISYHPNDEEDPGGGTIYVAGTGLTYYESAIDDENEFWSVRHKRGGQYSAWAAANSTIRE